MVAGAEATADGAQQTAPDESISLAELAREAEAIVLAQVRDTDYIYRRRFPAAGSAFLKVLIAYKLDKAVDMIEIHEQGLHPHECYFPNPSVFEEGRRYLLFLKKDQDSPHRYRGLAQGCALEVLVDRNNHYVVRLPASGIHLSDPLNDLGRTFEFTDRHALEDDETLPPQQRNALLAAGWIERKGDHYVYTRGVQLSTVRELMGNFGVAARGVQKNVDQASDPANPAVTH